LARCKAKIVIWDVDEKSSKSLMTELKAQGCDAYFYKVDVSDRLQVESAALKVRYNLII
jgi:hypothetical protein